MRTQDPHPPHDAVEAAIARVLAAEVEAGKAVADARVAAAAHAEATRAAIRAIEQRTQRRIAAARARFDRAVLAQVAALAAEGERIAHAPAMSDPELAALAQGLSALAEEITGLSR